VSSPDSSDPIDADWERDLQRLRESYRRKLRGEIATLDANGPEASCAPLEGIEQQLEQLLRRTAPDLHAAWAAIEEALGRVPAGLE